MKGRKQTGQPVKESHPSRRRRDHPCRIGIIADTHGLFDRAILRHFHGVDHILHAGDIGDRSVLVELEKIAPVTAVSGNVDGYERSGLEAETLLALGGRRFAIKHILYAGGKLTKEGRAFLDRERPDVCIFGHTHQPKTDWYGPTLLFNPGSAGPKRFKLPRGLGILTIEKGALTPTHIRLDDPVVGPPTVADVRGSVMKAIAMVALALLSTACATIMNGSTQGVTVASEPPGATISVLGNELARTPATITLRRNQRHTILLSKQGYEERRVEVIGAPEHFVEATLGNLWNLFIGFYVDFLTGGAFELDPRVINATLPKQSDRPSP